MPLTHAFTNASACPHLPPLPVNHCLIKCVTILLSHRRPASARMSSSLRTTLVPCLTSAFPPRTPASQPPCRKCSWRSSTRGCQSTPSTPSGACARESWGAALGWSSLVGPVLEQRYCSTLPCLRAGGGCVRLPPDDRYFQARTILDSCPLSHLDQLALVGNAGTTLFSSCLFPGQRGHQRVVHARILPDLQRARRLCLPRGLSLGHYQRQRAAPRAAIDDCLR
jgi:hypothetical protein